VTTSVPLPNPAPLRESPAARAGPTSRRPGLGTLAAGAAILLAFVAAALLAPLIAPYDPIAQDAAARLQPPSASHWLGTDNFGRDILSRIVWGARTDLLIASLGVVFPFAIGLLAGTIAGYFGGLLDTLFMRVVDIVLAFPFLVLMLAILAVLGPGLSSFFIAMALVGWVSYARLVRAQLLVLRSADFAVAARSLGYSHGRVMFRHLLPNALVGPCVFAMSDAVLVLLNGASISYLGLGVQPPTPEWGVMVFEGQGFVTTAWWITAFPGLAIVLLAFGFSLLGDGLGEILGTRE
jgi:peptide/nickel transport system permease protein